MGATDATFRVMSVALRKPMTVAEFLAWEERQELRWEFDGFQPVAMTGVHTRTRQLAGTSALPCGAASVAAHAVFKAQP